MILGTAQLGQAYGVSNSEGMLSENEAELILDAARLMGIDMLDTATSYGESEARIGAYLNVHPSSFAVSTKLPPNVMGRRQVLQTLEESAKLLHTDSVDCVYLHRFQQFLNQKVMLGLSDALDRGIARRAGVSVYYPQELKRIALLPQCISVVQIPYNVLSAAVWEEALRVARSAGLTLYARSVYLQGLCFLDPRSSRVSALGASRWIASLRRLAEEKGCGVASYCWGFVAARPEIDDVIIGCESVSQVCENAALEGLLPVFAEGDVRAALSTFSNVPERVINPTLWPSWG